MSFSVEDCIEVPVTKKETVHLLFNLQQAYGETATICRTYNVTSDELEKAYADKLLIPSGVTSIGQYAFTNCHNLSSATFANPSGWYVGTSAGEKKTAIDKSSLSNVGTAAQYLRTTYSSKFWAHD